MDNTVTVCQNNVSTFQEAVNQRGKQRQRDKDGEVLGGWSGRQLRRQAADEHGCITRVNKAQGWDVVSNRGSGPSVKNADNTGYVSTTLVMGANCLDPVEFAVTVLWTVPAHDLFFWPTNLDLKRVNPHRK